MYEMFLACLIVTCQLHSAFTQRWWYGTVPSYTQHTWKDSQYKVAGWTPTSTTEPTLGSNDRINTTDVPEEIEARPDLTRPQRRQLLRRMNPGSTSHQIEAQLARDDEARARMAATQSEPVVQTHNRRQPQHSRFRPSTTRFGERQSPRGLQRSHLVSRRPRPRPRSRPIPRSRPPPRLHKRPRIRLLPQPRPRSTTTPGYAGYVTVTASRSWNDNVYKVAGWAPSTTEPALGPNDRINTTDVPEEIEAHPDLTRTQRRQLLRRMNPGSTSQQIEAQLARDDEARARMAATQSEPLVSAPPPPTTLPSTYPTTHNWYSPTTYEWIQHPLDHGQGGGSQWYPGRRGTDAEYESRDQWQRNNIESETFQA